jgi:hypothetical protein
MNEFVRLLNTYIESRQNSLNDNLIYFGILGLLTPIIKVSL